MSMLIVWMKRRRKREERKRNIEHRYILSTANCMPIYIQLEPMEEEGEEQNYSIH